MTSKEEIKNAFISELKNTDEYKNILLPIKNLILNEIATPNIKKYIIYQFEKPITQEQIEIVKMCIKIEFGFLETNISEYNIGIDMSKFLE